MRSNYAARSTRYELSSLLDALRGLTWPARRPVRGVTAGTHRSRMHGISPEFTEYRPFRQGDDARRLDWKLLARTDRAYLRVTRDRATVGTLVIVDASASMAFPVDTLDKWVQACRLAVGLLAVAHAAGDPVGILVPTARGVRHLAPRTRRGVLAEVARLLAEIEPTGGAPLAAACRLMRTTHRAVIVSDFLGDGDDVLSASRERMIAGAEIYAVHVVAREELDPPDVAILATDPEHPDVQRPLAEATRDEYRSSFAEWREGIARSWRDAGTSYVMVATDEPADRAVRCVIEPLAVSSARHP
jgi:uncharacterized protein (DUF58 family)